MKITQYRFLHILLCTCCMAFSIHFMYGQEVHTGKTREIPQKTYREYLHDLHDGVLIVRIPTYSAQIEYLEKALEDNESKYMRKKLIKYKDKREKMKRDCIDGFQDNYDFSEVYFIADTSMSTFLATYDEEHLLKGNSLASYDRKKLFFCIKGNTSQYSNGHKAAWLIMDYRMKPLPDRFPYYVGERNVVQSLFSIFTSIFGGTYQRSMAEIATKFNEQFYKKLF